MTENGERSTIPRESRRSWPAGPEGDGARGAAARTGRRGTLTAAALAGALALLAAACSDGPSAPAGSAGLTDQEARDLAAAMGGQSADLVEGQAGSLSSTVSARAAGDAPTVSAATFGPVGFDRSRDCPDGGTVDVSGTVQGETDPEAGTATAHVEADVVHAGCGFPIRGTTVTVTGDPGLDFVADLSVLDGQLDGPQTASLAGSFAWEAADGRSDTCEAALDWTLDPAARTLSLVGTICDVQIDRTLSRGD